MSVTSSSDRKNGLGRGGRNRSAATGTSGGPFITVRRPPSTASRSGAPVDSSKKIPTRPATSTPDTATGPGGGALRSTGGR